MTDPRDTLKRAAELLRQRHAIGSEGWNYARALDRMAEQEPFPCNWCIAHKCPHYPKEK